MTEMVTISDLRFLDAAADDDPDDSDYEPTPSELVSDVSMASNTNSVVSHVTSSDVSIPSAVPSDVLSAADPFEIFPDDSISQRNAKLAAQTRHHFQRPPSEASEAPSIISFHSSVDGHIFKTLHGRSFGRSDHYMLPADDDEHSRLDMQHLALRFHLNSLYASRHLVENALREGQDPAPVILDVGTGSGRWAIDMALQFPHAQVIGLDLVPPAKVGEMTIPPNCRFEVDDANLTFEHYHQFFRLVHVRSADQGINDFESFLYEIARTLLPGGILLLVTGYPQIYDVDKKPFPVVEEGEPNFSWLQHTFAATYTAFQNRNNTVVDCSLYWQQWLERNPNYRSPMTRDTFIPLGPFKPNMSRREAFVSDLMREDIARIMHAFKPLLLGDGIKEEVVDLWIANSVKELRDLSICGHIKWRYTVAIRNTLPWQTRLEVPESLDLPRQRMVVPKTPKGFVPVGCSTNITARVSAGPSTTSEVATATPWTTVPGPGGVPLGPIAK